MRQLTAPRNAVQMVTVAIYAIALSASALAGAPIADAAPFSNCAAAEAAGAAPLYAGQPGYSTKLDRDRDGVACETGSGSSGGSIAAPFIPMPPSVYAPAPVVAPNNNDLALATAPTYQACEPPTGIVVIESVFNPGSYAADVQRLIDANPGALWLRTDQSCPSLRRATDTGGPIYAVYRVAGYTEADICTAVRAEGGIAYGKWMDTVHSPDYVVPC
jgi:serine/threonine protein kinase, bacterial